MGCFSWLDCVTKEQIKIGSDRMIYVLIPERYSRKYGKKISTKYYDGYGVFCCYDIFDLIAHWNMPKSCSGDYDHDRNIGIDLWTDDDRQSLKYPIKITYDPNVTYEQCDPSNDDPDQGL